MSRSALDRFFRNPDTGNVVIAQAPNRPLWIFLAATVVRLVARPDGTAATATGLVGTAALAWWATDEVLRGDSPFRRVLGSVVLVATVIGLLTR